MKTHQEWDPPPVKDLAEQEFDRAKNIADSMPLKDGAEFLQGEEQKLKIRREYERRMKNLKAILVGAGIVAVLIVIFVGCSFLLGRSSYGVPRFRGTILEGSEGILRLVQMFALYMAPIFGMTLVIFGLFWMFSKLRGKLREWMGR